MSKTGKFIAGAILGAAAAALLTPVSGKKARAKINATAKKAGIDLGKYGVKIDKVVDAGSEILRQISQGAPNKTKVKK